MRYYVVDLIAKLFIILGCVNRTKKKLLNEPVILSIYFHNPSRKLFKKCIKWLYKNKFTFISLDELNDILYGKKDFSNGLVCITVDDGFRDNLNNVIPVVCEYSIPITFFISTEPVKNGVFWWSFAQKDSRFSKNGFKNKNIIKSMQESDRLKYLNEIRSKYSIDREAMTPEEIAEISEISEVTIGSHTVNHSIVINCTDEESEREIRESKSIIQKWINKEVKYFSYPNGNFSKREKIYLMKNGYQLAFTTKPSFISSIDRNNLFCLPRFSVNDDGSFSENLLKMLGIWQKYINCSSLFNIKRKKK